MKGDSICPDELDEQRRDGTFGEPLAEREEEQLGTSVSVLLPSIELPISIIVCVIVGMLTSSSAVKDTPSWKPPFE